MARRVPLPPVRPTRRGFLSSLGLGCGGLALADLMMSDAARGSETANAPPDGKPHFAPKAKSVIWVFLSGGVSHLETFDPKPKLNSLVGKTYADSGSPNPQKDPLFLARSRSVVGFDRDLFSKIMPLQVGFKKHGRSGLEVSDWLPHLAGCADDLAVVRSMWTTDNDHAAEWQFHTGRHALDEKQPALGAWVQYALGSLNENLPRFVFLGTYSDKRAKLNFDPHYLGPAHGPVELNPAAARPLEFATPPPGVTAAETADHFALVSELNRAAAAGRPHDDKLKARLQSYELAARMQLAVPEALDLARETKETQALYGIDDPDSAAIGRQLLKARRLAERGVRFTLVYPHNTGSWDSHSELQKNHARLCKQVDKPLAGLVQDLKRTGLDKDVTVVCLTEFGRTPAVEDRGGQGLKATGRDHHPHGFSIWFSGAGVKRGVVHGATDELGFHAVEHPHYVTDVHATVLHLLGLDGRKMDVPGRKRLEIDYGTPITHILT